MNSIEDARYGLDRGGIMSTIHLTSNHGLPPGKPLQKTMVKSTISIICTYTIPNMSKSPCLFCVPISALPSFLTHVFNFSNFLPITRGFDFDVSQVGFAKMRGLAMDGNCKTFDTAADGFARGEGMGPGPQVLRCCEISWGFTKGHRWIFFRGGGVTSKERETWWRSGLEWDFDGFLLVYLFGNDYYSEILMGYWCNIKQGNISNVIIPLKIETPETMVTCRGGESHNHINHIP